jgi:hypothetical protein
MSSDPELIERQLLIAALVQGVLPKIKLDRANTWRVVDQVLSWHGLTTEQIEAGWRTHDCDLEHELVYSALVKMIHTCVNGEKLFEGHGNWGVPGDASQPACHPQYNSCRLTAEGEKLAILILEKHPGYR